MSECSRERQLRDDPFARQAQVGQALMPAYFLDAPDDSGRSTIRSTRNPKVEFGAVDLATLRVSLVLTEIFDESIEEEEAVERLYEGPGEAIHPEEWVEHGWSAPETDLWYEEDDDTVWGGSLSMYAQGKNCEDLVHKLVGA